jgi:aminomethyltransferase
VLIASHLMPFRRMELQYNIPSQMDGESPVPPRTTPLNATHRSHGAHLVDFAGWEMPLYYTGIIDEHVAVRTRAGLFDVSHMGRLFVRGPGAPDFLQHMLTNDVSRLNQGQGHYTLALNSAGGVRDDIILFRLEGEFLVIVNASNRTKIMEHFSMHAVPGVVIADRSVDLAMIALQGPASGAILARLTEIPAPSGRFGIGSISVAGRRMLVSRTGYTGEDGFELYPESGDAAAVWEALRQAGQADGIANCGLGARDGLRLEVGYSLYGHEIGEETYPWEAGLGWAVKPDKGDFLGRSAALAVRDRGLSRHLIGLTCTGPGVPRQGCELTRDGRNAGVVTSGTFSPMLKTGIALGYIAKAVGPSRGPLAVVVRNKPLPVVEVKMPFYKSGGVGVVGKEYTSAERKNK